MKVKYRLDSLELDLRCAIGNLQTALALMERMRLNPYEAHMMSTEARKRIGVADGCLITIGRYPIEESKK